MLLIGKVMVGDSDFFSITVPYPKPLTMARPAVFLSVKTSPASQTASVLSPSAHSSVQTYTKDTMARALHPEGCTWTEHTWQIWLSHAPCCHLAHGSHQRPWQTQTPQLSMDSFLKGYFYTQRIKHPLKITVSVPESLIVMLWHRLLWALHQLEPSTCGILKLCHIRYITFQINSGKLDLKYAVSCYWFFTIKDKYGIFSSNAEVFLTALAKPG